MTVYTRMQHYAKTSTFVFRPGASTLLGQFVAREWRRNGGKMEDLEVIQSVEIEPDGAIKHYMVFCYPDSFTTTIDIVIQRFVSWCLAPKKPKVIDEKPLIKDPARPISYTSDPPKKRTRIPIQYKPHFSGKKLIEKK
jgi:hypothetical protein